MTGTRTPGRASSPARPRHGQGVHEAGLGRAWPADRAVRGGARPRLARSRRAQAVLRTQIAERLAGVRQASPGRFEHRDRQGSGFEDLEQAIETARERPQGPGRGGDGRDRDGVRRPGGRGRRPARGQRARPGHGGRPRTSTTSRRNTWPRRPRWSSRPPFPSRRSPRSGGWPARRSTRSPARAWPGWTSSTPGGQVLVNEINTMPGMTPASGFPKMWAATGLPLPQLVDRIIQTALSKRPGLRLALAPAAAGLASRPGSGLRPALAPETAAGGAGTPPDAAAAPRCWPRPAISRASRR